MSSRKRYHKPVQVEEVGIPEPVEEEAVVVEAEPVVEPELEKPVIEETVAEENAVVMEPDEYMEYIQNQVKDMPEEEKTPVAQVSMFQMNKDLVRSLKKMTNMEVNKALEAIKEWYLDKVQDPELKHFALLNHEKHYFTIFAANPIKRAVRFTPEDSFIKELKDVLMNHYGDKDLRSIEVEKIDDKPSGAVEVWAMWDGEPTVAYLFPYEQGVVYY